MSTAPDILPSFFAPRPHLSGYQARDYEVVDYQMYELPGTGLSFRGPPPPSLKPGSYFTCVGAAQTLGCFCQDPYPTLLSRALGLPVLNLGYGGAGPEFFAREPALDRFINGGRFVVIQAMSGRSQSNRWFDCVGLEYVTRRKDGARLGAYAAYREMLAGPRWLRRLPGGRLPARLVALPGMRQVVKETRRRWLETHQWWLSRLTVPKVFLWYSRRPPRYRTGYRNMHRLFGDFPQLVNAEMVEVMRGHCDRYVECVSARGTPQLLRSRFTGEPTSIDPSLDRPDLGGTRWTHNRYYPSPEMHEDAAAALLPVCHELLDSGAA